MVEHATENRSVGGSIPPLGTITPGFGPSPATDFREAESAVKVVARRACGSHISDIDDRKPGRNTMTVRALMGILACLLMLATPHASAAQRAADGVDELARDVTRLESLRAVKDLQRAWSHYAQFGLWSEMAGLFADLFAPDGVLTIEGVGRFVGKPAIRRALERQGPAGLRHGELFDHPQLDTTVEVAESGAEARARGLELGMTGMNGGEAFWTLTTFDNRFVRRADGVWTIAEMRLYPEMKADYYRGWDAGAPNAETATRRIAAFGSNPATGAAVRYPTGLEPVAHPFAGDASAPDESDLAAAERALARAGAFDAIENISSSIGNYLNDSLWYELSRLFARDGWRKSPSAGYYRGRDRIWRMQFARNGPMRRPRSGIPLHLRIQPVIHVAGDGRTAKLRTRLLQFNSSRAGEGSMTGGMYEDRLVLEDGIWRFELDDIDHIWRTPDYSRGWARVEEGAGERLSRTPDRLLAEMPPDRPLEGRAFPPFPAIGRLWFHYRNPVSGRAPPDLLPE